MNETAANNKKPATVLFVDDEERILRTMKMLFKSSYNVRTTTDGKEAIEILKQEPVHVLISDQRMPAITGVEVLRQAREVSPNTLRLLLTGYSDLSAMIGSVNEGEIFRYINKPWDNHELRGAIDTSVKIALNLWQDTRPSPSKPGNTPVQTIRSPAETSHIGILLIDDDRVSYDSIHEITGQDYELFWARTLDEAFNYLVENPQIALIFSEVRVGEDDITEPLKTLKQHYPKILTLVLTSFQDTKLLIELINQGQIYRFLPKPILKGLLEKSLHMAVQHYQMLESDPELLSRHTVEKNQDIKNTSITDRIVRFLSRMRGN